MRVLVIKLSSLGDLFHALPAAHNLKAELGAEIDWVVQSEYVDLVRCFTDVSNIIPFHRRHAIRTMKAFLENLRSRNYDMVVDLQGLLKSALIARAARAPRRIGPSFNREGASLFYTETAGQRNKKRHAVEENLDVVSHLGLKCLNPEFPVVFPKRAIAEKRPRIAVFPVSRWRTKNWPPACFVDVIRLIRRYHEASFFILGGPIDRPVCSFIEGQAGGGAQNLAGSLSLVETGSLLAEMDLLISNDSGPVHMAAALGVPTLVIFGPTDPARTGPYGEIHRVVRTKLPCQPCYSRACRLGGLPCLDGITPEHVGELALEMLKSPRKLA